MLGIRMIVFCPMVSYIFVHGICGTVHYACQTNIVLTFWHSQTLKYCFKINRSGIRSQIREFWNPKKWQLTGEKSPFLPMEILWKYVVKSMVVRP